MTSNSTAAFLYPDYIIDGVRMENSPYEMLEAACGRAPRADVPAGPEPVVDECLDPDPADGQFDRDRLAAYAAAVTAALKKERPIPFAYAAPLTRGRLAASLIDTLWQKGHYRISDISLEAAWRWNGEPVGSMAAFYASVEAACEYLDALGIRLDRYSVTPAPRSGVAFSAAVSGVPETALIDELPFRTVNPRMSRWRRCPGRIVGKDSGWLVYIPFDSCGFRLGGSVLSAATGIPCGKAVETADPDYFIDCFEVVRELVEDGIVLSAVTVGAGGLLSGLCRILTADCGIRADLSGICRSYGEKDIIPVLFGEVPGAILEIGDADYDYVDAELLLQDVAYYPLGHPDHKLRDIRITDSDAWGLAGILQSLLSAPASEGED